MGEALAKKAESYKRTGNLFSFRFLKAIRTHMVVVKEEVGTPSSSTSPREDGGSPRPLEGQEEFDTKTYALCEF